MYGIQEMGVVSGSAAGTLIHFQHCRKCSRCLLVISVKGPICTDKPHDLVKIMDFADKRLSMPTKRLGLQTKFFQGDVLMPPCNRLKGYVSKCSLKLRPSYTK